MPTGRKENSTGPNKSNILKWTALICSKQAWLCMLNTRQEMFVPQGCTCDVCRQLNRSETTPSRDHIASFIFSLEPASKTWASHWEEHRPGCPSTILIKVSANTLHSSDFNRSSWNTYCSDLGSVQKSTRLINYFCHPHLKEKHFCVVMMMQYRSGSREEYSTNPLT